MNSSSWDTDAPCPCDSGNAFQHCCQPILAGKKTAKTAAELMRSRYSAYVVGDSHYLIETHHPSKRGELTIESLDKYHEEIRWLSLKIKRTERGGSQDNQGKVSFVASFDDGRRGKLRETSRFVKEQGRWYYLDGKVSSSYD